MQNPNLFIINNNTTLRRKNNVIQINVDGKDVESIPINMVKNIFCFGKVNIDTTLINFLSHNNKNLFLLDQFGKIKTMVLSTIFKSSVKNRKVQIICSENYEFRVNFIKKILKMKMSSILGYYKAYLKENDLYSKQEIINKSNLFERMLFKSNSVDELRGVDGWMSKFMFEIFKKVLENSHLKFQNRNYHPPTDPVNAVLSFTYTVYHNYLYCYLIDKGFDPYVGFMHIKKGNHAAFVSDILEIFRPALTFFVSSIIRDEIVSLEDFLYKKELCIIIGKAKKRILHKMIEYVWNNKSDSFNSKIDELLEYFYEEEYLDKFYSIP